MVHSSLSEMFSSLGWGSGFKLPISNAINCKLERELEEKQKLVLRLSAELEDHSQHVDTLSSQTERVKEEIECGQKVIEARRSEIEIEGTLFAISTRTFSKAKEDRKKLCRRILEISKRNAVVNNELCKRQRSIDELVGMVEFDKNALERYKDSIEEKENYIAFIEQFADMDKKSIEECKKKYHNLSNSNSEATKELDESYRTTVALQSQLDQNTHLLRRVNKERMEALDLWKTTLTSMKSRDDEMNEVAKSYAETRIAVRAVRGILCHRQEMFETEVQGTKEAYRQQAILDRRICLFKENWNNNKSSVHNMKEMISKLKGEIKYFTHEKNATASKITSLEQELVNWDLDIEKTTRELDSLKERHKMVIGASLNSEEQMKEVNSLLNQETDKVDSFIAKLERQRYNVWQRSGQKKELQDELLALLDFSIRQRKTRLAQIKEEMLKQDDLLHKRKITIYAVELESFQLESRCMRMENPLANTNVQELQEKQMQIDKLTVELKKYEETKIYLAQQFQHVFDTGKRILSQLRSSVHDQRYLKGRAIECRLECDKCIIELKTKRKIMRDSTVEYRLIQVQLKRLKDVDLTRVNAIFDLESDRLLMRTVAKEKKVEIEVHASMLTSKKRFLQDERSKLRMEISEMQCALENLRKKYDIIMYTMQTEKDQGDTEIHSEAYYVIKRAEQNEILRREGDLWDARVKEAEKEIIALQNTLTLIFNSNHSFKDSLTPIVESSEEYAAIKQFEEESAIALMRKKKCDRMISKLMIDIEIAKSNIKQVAHDVYSRNHDCWERNYELRSILTDVENQNTKIKRANIMANKILRELAPQSEHERNFIELDLKFLATKTKLEYALTTLERFVTIFPNAKTSVVEYLHVKGMKHVAARIMNSGKSGASSAASTPHRSGRGTPTSGKNNSSKSAPPSSKSEKSESSAPETNTELLQKELQQLYSHHSASESVEAEENKITPDNNEGAQGGDENLAQMPGFNESPSHSKEIPGKESKSSDEAEVNSSVHSVEDFNLQE